MAFVSRSERKLQVPETLSVGPGAYSYKLEAAPASSYAPFASTSLRDTSKLFCKNHTPGPGTYTYQLQSPPNSQNHWTQAKFSAAFASKNSRFPEKKSESSPGPGSYLSQDPWKKPNVLEKNFSLNWSRVPSAPSIPANHQSHGYDQTERGVLVMQKGPETIYSGTKTDSVGPGHYETLQKANSNGPKWYKSASSREIFARTTTGPGLGPGTYTEERMQITSSYKFKSSAVFAKKTSENLIKEENNSPGPGTYAIDQITSFKNKKLPERLQNFGSSTLRFERVLKQNEVGPGYYNINDKGISNGDLGAKVPFSSSNLRFCYKAENNPGPGTYENSLSSDRTKSLANQGFGSNTQRFIEKVDQNAPGPGHYKPKNVLKKGLKKENAAFASKVKRGDYKLNENPAPWDYEAAKGFAERKKTPVVGSHPVLIRSESGNNGKTLGFASSVERFFEKKGSEHVGPGCYDVDVKQKAKKVIVAMEKRFKDKGKKDVPGPGTYYGEVDEAWNKKSYNVLFSEIEG